MNLRKLTHKQLADLCGVTRQAVTDWCSNGMPTTGREGIDLETALPWIIKSRYTPPGSERERLARAQADKFELDNAVTRGSLMYVDQFKDAIFSVATAVSGAMDARPGRLASELCSITDPALMRARLQDEFRDIRQFVAHEVAKLAEREIVDTDSGEDADAAAPENGEPVG